MTLDASLPPADSRLTEQEKAANRRRWWGLTDSADVQRPTPPLTDEELAERINTLPVYVLSMVGFLIDALRARRVEITNLRRLNEPLKETELEQWDAGVLPYGATREGIARRLIANLRAASERIEVLEAELDEERAARRFYHYG